MNKNLKVLVVHRQVSVANDIRKQFDRAGWLVHMAHSGLDGLLSARKESFGLILSAIDLPVITGIEMLRAIRNFSFNVNTPAIFLDQLPNGYDEILSKLRISVLSTDPAELLQLTRMYDRVQTANYLGVEPLDNITIEK